MHHLYFNFRESKLRPFSEVLYLKLKSLCFVYLIGHNYYPVLSLYTSEGTCALMSRPNDKFEKLSRAVLFGLRELPQEFLFFYTCFVCEILTQSFSSQTIKYLMTEMIQNGLFVFIFLIKTY